jgi:hypothetical protein
VEQTIDKAALLDRVTALKQSLEALPPSEPIQKAIYHADQLHIALKASHNEGIRFAAFTVARLIKNSERELPPQVPALMAEIKAALEAIGIDLQK